MNKRTPYMKEWRHKNRAHINQYKREWSRKRRGSPLAALNTLQFTPRAVTNIPRISDTERNSERVARYIEEAKHKKEKGARKERKESSVPFPNAVNKGERCQHCGMLKRYVDKGHNCLQTVFLSQHGEIVTI